MKIEPPGDRASLLAATANRLRLIQVDFADEPATVREGYLADELERAVGQLPPEHRATFLDDLARVFPTWDQNVAVPPAQVGSNGQALMDRKELQDPGFLVTRLAELTAALSPERKRQLADPLIRVGLLPAEATTWPAAEVAALRQALPLPADRAPDAERVLALIVLLMDFVTSLEQIVWNMWKTLTPQTPPRRGAGLQKMVGQYLGGDAAISRHDLEQELERLRRHSAALVSAIGQTGREFAQHYAAKFAPAEIEAAIRLEPKKIFTALETLCWKKYVELAAGMSEATVDREIMQAVAESAQSLIRGLAR